MEKKNLRKYTVEMYETEDQGRCLLRVNEGFTDIELLGLLELIQVEIIEQMKGEIKPDIIKRQVVIESES